MWAPVNLLAGYERTISHDQPAVMYPRRALLQMERHLAGANIFSGWETVGHGGQKTKIRLLDDQKVVFAYSINMDIFRKIAEFSAQSRINSRASDAPCWWDVTVPMMTSSTSAVLIWNDWSFSFTTICLNVAKHSSWNGVKTLFPGPPGARELPVSVTPGRKHVFHGLLRLFLAVSFVWLIHYCLGGVFTEAIPPTFSSLCEWS